MFVDANGKEFESIQGRKATVVKDLYDFFKEGDRVVILENDKVPCCIGIDNYKEACNSTDNYDIKLCWDMYADIELIIEGDEE